MWLTIYLVAAAVVWLAFLVLGKVTGWLGSGGGDVAVFLLIASTMSLLWLPVVVGIGAYFLVAIVFRFVGPKAHLTERP